ncbi:SUMF1/EgtB/PvdO family nonheme iron enzyme [Pseudoalteromonas luteoviolacea]|uniref:Sulfatase-modifying factor enzyme-like domain-containing protein n=1 Tax=Pseudoalteromonas luteoviolacea H33 TaxID=1365251 RepID=A0A167DQF4_9GAMM|nr:SUMF1/EgtB/PvdO family nonheme iron enzyme [Pseudoalteromonas luteoviolacea]KZN49199.1 hypothetical protein N476_20390 [Pseudoalteromonas luteoviolacea H33]KZN73629.1 hypothetical protein N477_23290 [Pseudoalteromonas luteoviolacea H33-S]MBQ4875638.1 SUMF1/EgtB/PvdO family nonheme iron enzyme [Pseudoalteromonas luteoviolacea]MBQ4904673.1 SUMF1/EgtB/PvdO family nonheme iron enzyme [Pseudoalteromonas luteoviolacea]
MRSHLFVFSAATLVSLATILPVQSKQTTYIEPPMVSIPKGTFTMGSTEGRQDELPIRKVTVPAFQMGKYEVTVAEYRKFIEATGYESTKGCVHRIGPQWFGSGERDGTWDDNIYVLSEFHPVVCVSRIDAINYAKWLSKASGDQYRLPTEAEWEYAVRAGTKSKYFFGDENRSVDACRYANIADIHAYSLSGKLYDAPYAQDAINACNDNEVMISTVGLYKPNGFGLHDMEGNVVERLADCYQDSYEGAPVDGSAVTKKDCETFVARGGSWHWPAFGSSRRMMMYEDFFAALEGFRLVKDTNGKALEATEGTPWFVKQLNKAQKNARNKHKKENPHYPKQLNDVKLSRLSKDKVKITWQAEQKSGVTGYEIVRQDPLTNQSVTLVKLSHKQTSFIDDTALSHNGRYSVVALNGSAKSLPSPFFDSASKQPHVIPSRIEGEAFNFAPGATVVNSSFEPEGDKIIGSIGTSKASYILEAQTAGDYLMTIRLFHSGPTQNYTLMLNGDPITTSVLSGERGWRTIKDIKVKFEQGQQTLTIQGETAIFAVNWFDIAMR